MVTRAERKVLEKKGWKSTGDVGHALAHDLKVNAGTWSMRVVELLNALLDVKGRAYEQQHVKRLGRYTFIDAVCYGHIKAEVKRLRRRIGDPRA